MEKKFPNLLQRTKFQEHQADYRILLMHQLVESSIVGLHKYQFSSYNTEVLPLDWIPKNFNYIALGHTINIKN